MYHYTLTQWIFFFIIYCVFGWIIESSWVSLRTRHLTNRGFMRGPWLPIYGSGAIVLLICANPFSKSLFLTFLAGMLGASVLEFVTGEAMEALFKVRYWDYSNQPFNIKGQVCLGTSLSWGALTIVLTRYLHREVDALASKIPTVILTRTTVILSIIILVDFTLSFKAAIDLRNVLIQMERAKEEMERIRRRMDVLAAVTKDELETRRQQVYERSSELTAYLESTFANVKERIRLDPNGRIARARDEVYELRGKYTALREHYLNLSSLRSYFQRSMLRGNPDMVSGRFADALEMLRQGSVEHRASAQSHTEPQSTTPGDPKE